MDGGLFKSELASNKKVGLLIQYEQNFWLRIFFVTDFFEIQVVSDFWGFYIPFWTLYFWCQIAAESTVS